MHRKYLLARKYLFISSSQANYAYQLQKFESFMCWSMVYSLCVVGYFIARTCPKFNFFYIGSAEAEVRTRVF